MKQLSTILIVLATACGLAPGQSRPAMEFIHVAEDGSGFVTSATASRFVPWGFNYDRDFRMRLIEDYWEEEWATIEEDFREMKEMGANIVRLHLQFARFMDAADRPNEANHRRLERLVRVAEGLGLYLDLTGLGCYRKQDVPPWFDQLDEPQRWAAQASFWEAIARTCADRPGVFCYNLINEPVVPAGKLPSGQWLHPAALAGFHYVQHVALDPAGRDRHEIAQQWTRQMTAAIRKHDRRHMITIGMLPMAGSGLDPAKLADELDFIAVHVYPERGKLDDAIGTLKSFKISRKPQVIEETFPLHANAKELGEFITRSRGVASGCIGFYWGKTPDELEASPDISDKITLAWLNLFREMNPNLQP